MTQKDWIIKYLKVHGSVTPARMGGRVWGERIWPACGMRRCQEMEKDGILTSYKDGQFKTFILKRESPSLFETTVDLNIDKDQVTINGQRFKIV